jgi:predicted nucleic acid-binding protein
MRRVVIDSDIAIDYLRGREYALKLMKKLWRIDAAFLSTTTLFELYAGMRDSEKESTENFVQACNILPVTSQISMVAGELYRIQRKQGKQGKTLDAIDCINHAVAIVHNLQLATRNVSHYPDCDRLLAIDE